jgi:hypothetical protein
MAKKAREAFRDYVAKMSLKYINQTKDEMLREVEEDVEQMKIHAIKKVIATSIKNSLIIPSPNTDEDVTYMEKLGFILNKDKNGKYHVDLDDAKDDSEARGYINQIQGERGEAAKYIVGKIKKAMVDDENKVIITSAIYEMPYRSRLKYFDEWLSPELERAGFKPTLVDDDHYSISW